jgi:hypothetical protein
MSKHLQPEGWDGLESPDSPFPPAEADFAPFEETSGAPAPSGGDPFHADSLEAQRIFEEAVEAAADGTSDHAIELLLRAAKTAEGAREWYLAAVCCQKIGGFLLAGPPPHDLERAFRMYRRAIAAYDLSGLFAEARELGYRHMWLRLTRASELGVSPLKKLELFLHWAIAGFGYRPLRVVGTAGVVILGFALLYWVTGGAHSPGAPHPLSFGEAFYFSGITFATIGFGDFIPYPSLRLVALLEGCLGVLMMGLFVAVLANRLSKA